MWSMSEQRKPGDERYDHDNEQRDATLQARRDFLMLLSQGTFIAAAGLTAACDLPAAPTTGSGGSSSSSSGSSSSSSSSCSSSSSRSSNSSGSSSSSSSGSLTPSRSTLHTQNAGEEGPLPGLLV